MIKSGTASAIHEALIAKNECMIAFLRRLVETESHSHDQSALSRVLGLLEDKWKSLGWVTRRIRGHKSGGHLFARPARRPRHRPVQVMIGHCDTVWPPETLQTMPIRFSEDRLHGPGIFDMKAGLTQMVFAMETIQELSIQPQVTPVVFVNSDEEVGSRESTPWIRRLARLADRALILEPPLEGKLKTTRKGIGRFTIAVKGKPAHAGLDPGKGASAILELSHLIQKLFALNDLERGISVNVGKIDGGISANVIAPESKAVIDVRVPTQDDAADITERIYGLKSENPDVEIHVEGRIGRPPMEATPRNRRLWEQARAAGQALGMELQESSAGGGSDGNTTSQYTATLDGLGTVGDGAHAVHEHIEAFHIVERTALLAVLLLAPPTSPAKT
ncbi:MAG: M20 family metallopeptidase [Pirellulaceae bacterium]